jgi:hypothetical protein
MKMMRLFLAISCLLGLVASGFAQDVQTKKTPGILGYLDPKTGTFRILPTPGTSPAESPTVTPTTGKLVFNITIAVNPGLSSSAKILCTATAAVSEASTAGVFEDTGAVAATRTGGTAKCSVTLPYGWNLANPSSDRVGLSVNVTATVGTGAPPFTENISSQSLSIAVPPSGTTTTEAISTTI